MANAGMDVPVQVAALTRYLQQARLRYISKYQLCTGRQLYALMAGALEHLAATGTSLKKRFTVQVPSFPNRQELARDGAFIDHSLHKFALKLRVEIKQKKSKRIHILT